jgi:lipopolysaccharide transport system ATP-binding protein
VAFSGVEQFLDTPVKYYSSGMYVRLAFSVAAHMEPDILLIDEVLAVGDAEFQKKCLGKMEEVTKTDGRTILFVSHNMGAIKQLCTKTLLLQKGKAVYFGETNKAIEKYLKQTHRSSKNALDLYITKYIKSVVLKNSRGESSNCIFTKDDFSVEVELHSDTLIEKPALSIGITSSGGGGRITTFNTTVQQNNLWSLQENKKVVFSVKNFMLDQGMYDMEVNLWNGGREMEQLLGCLQFEILPTDIYGTGKLPLKGQGFYLADVKIDIQ